MGRRAGRAGGVWLTALVTYAAAGHETDQFTVPLGKEFADLGEHLGGQFYETIESAVERTNGQIRRAIESGLDPAHVEQLQSPPVLAKAVFGEFPPAFFLIENLENELHYGPTRRKYPGKIVGYRETIKNIYQNVHFPLDPRQVFRIWHASTMKVYGTYLGPDKIGHLADMGYQYYVAYGKALADGADEAAAVEAAVRIGTEGFLFAEEGMVGFLSAGAWSNADLAANFVGLKFYCNLTEAISVEGELRRPLVVREGEYWRLAPHVRRDGDFLAWFISDHLNEAFNPSFFEAPMRPAVRLAVRARADRILEWYADDNGQRRPQRYFQEVHQALGTYWGEDYGHRGAPDELVSIANACFETPPDAQDPDVRSANGYTALHWAAHLGDPAAARRLLEAGAPANEPLRCRAVANSDWGSTPLHLAAAAGAVEVAAALLEHGADPNARAADGATPLHRAIGAPTVTALLLEAGADPEARDEQGRAPLHWLARYPKAKTLEYLLAAGASPDPRDHRGRTPLHRAARSGHLETIEALLTAGAEVESATELGVTPLHAAAAAGRAEAVALLLARGADPGRADEFGLTALHEAARRDALDVARELLAAGADPDRPDHYGSRPLHLAARWGREQVAETLIGAAADVNATNDLGSTPLHEAVAAGRAPMLHLLVAHGADPAARNLQGKTALELARWERSRPLAVLRLSGGAGLPTPAGTP